LQFYPRRFKGARICCVSIFSNAGRFPRQREGLPMARALHCQREFAGVAGVLDEDQIAWSVLYPTAGLTFGLVRDKDWACAVAAGYNNYLSETFTSRKSDSKEWR